MNPPAEVPLIGPIVVGYDDHPTSRRALTQAVDLARRLDQPLRVVHVIDLDDLPPDPDSGDWDRDVAHRASELEQYVRDKVRLPAQQWSYVATSGDVWHRLLRESEQLDAWLIVVGSHTHARGIATAVGHLFKGTLTGSITDSLVHSGRLSVLVVAGTADA